MNPPHDRYARSDGLRLRYWLEGASGPNLVLIHGIGGAVEVWRGSFSNSRTGIASWRLICPVAAAHRFQPGALPIHCVSLLNLYAT